MIKVVEYTVYVAFVISVVLNLFLLYIVKHYTARTMKVFANLIIQATVVDLVTSIVIMFMQLTVEAKAGIVFTGSGNPWLPLPGQWRCSPIMIFAVFMNMSFWSIPIQALYRYLVIVRKHKVSLWFPALLYAFVGVFIAAITFPTAFLSETNSPQLQGIRSMKFWRTEDTHALCTISILTWPVLLYLGGMSVLCDVGLFTLFWCNKQLYRTFNNSQMHFSAKTKQMHREMTHKLYAQAAVPMFMAVVFLVACTCLFLTPDYYGGFFVALLLPDHWIVVINPLVTLCCIKQYRSVAKAILQGRISEIKSNMSINRDSKGIAIVMSNNRSINSTITK
uniref:G_PROTEIN_RECEP_F1_2 domain-containing protein n=1 Tax=Panagrellus redivivus TaxID=6233 RepID=A0A7E4VH67_PANRE